MIQNSIRLRHLDDSKTPPGFSDSVILCDSVIQ